MRKDTLNIIKGVWPEDSAESCPDWAAENVDFALNPAYPTEYKTKYDPDFLPFWKEPAENVFNPTVREQAVLKCSQAGGTESCALNPIRYAVDRAPRRILYIWGDQKAAEDDFKERICGGLECSLATSKRLAAARSIECRLEFPDMVIAGAWPRNKLAFKRNPWSLIIADEFSTYPSLTPGMIRKRCDTVPFSHILWISSPDPQMKRPSSKDPIFIEYEAGDQRKWHMPDPKTKEMFVFEMGTPESFSGLKWSKRAKRKDGTWDLERVRKTAYYVTPGGTRIKSNQKRMDLVRKGQWIATNPDAPPWRRSYHINAFYMPFKSGDFGSIAVAFLEAKAQGTDALKVFVYEHLAEPFYEEKDTTKDDVIYKRKGEYDRLERMTDSEKYTDIYIQQETMMCLTADVQKGHHWYVAREWVENGDSGLVDWGYGIILEDLRAKDEELEADQVYIDNNYDERSMEVYEACLEWQWIPTIGSGSMALPFKKNSVNPFEGKVGAKAKKGVIQQITFHADVFKGVLMDLIRGSLAKKWYVYRKLEAQYVKQVMSEEKVDGVFVKKRGHPDNHLWDCEVLQLLAARVEKFYQHLAF